MAVSAAWARLRVRPAGLRHIGASAAALAAEALAPEPGEIDGIEAPRQIGRHGDHEGGALLAPGDQRHDARADLLLQRIGHALQLLGRHIVQQPGGELDARHILDGIVLAATAGGQALARLRQLALQALALLQQPGDALGQLGGLYPEGGGRLADEAVLLGDIGIGGRARSAPRSGAPRPRQRHRSRS